LFILLFCVLANPVQGLELTDLAGNRIVVPPYPKRIVSLAPSITESLFAIGCGEKVVGVTTFSNYPEEVKHLPKVGSYIRPSIEKIMALRPDLCLVTKDGNPKDLVYRLKSLGINIFAVDPKDINSLFNTMLTLGKLLGKEDYAKKVVLKLQKEVSIIVKKSKNFSKRPRVFFQIGIDPMVSVGGKTLIDNMIFLAGGINIFKETVRYPRISVEQVLAKDPEIIIITSMVHSRPNLERLKRFWLKYEEISAVKYGNVFVVNSDFFNRPSPRAVEGLKLLFMIFNKAQKKIYEQ